MSAEACPACGDHASRCGCSPHVVKTARSLNADLEHYKTRSALKAKEVKALTTRVDELKVSAGVNVALCRKITELEDELAPLRAGKWRGWRDVSVVRPEVDENVLVYSPDYGPLEARRDGDGWLCPDGRVRGVTHWQPMPERPVQTTKQENDT